LKVAGCLPFLSYCPKPAWSHSRMRL
jgi:hypothetical protein